MADGPLHVDTIPLSEAWLRHLADHAPVMMWASDAQMRTIWVNRQWLQFTGRTLAQELGAGWEDRVHPDDLEQATEGYARAFRAREPFELEYRTQVHDGSYRWVLDRATPRFDAAGTFQGFMGSCVDIQERKDAEGALTRVRELETRFTRFMEHLPGEAWIKDAEGRYLYVNENTLRVAGITNEAIIGHTDHEVFPPALADHFVDSDRAMRETGQGLELNDLLRRSDGLHHSLVVKFPIPDGEGRPPHLGAIAIDITEHKEAEVARAESEERFQMLADNIPQMAWIADAQGATTWVNQRMRDFAGWTLELPMAERVRRSVHPDDVEHLLTSARKGYASGAEWELTVRLHHHAGEQRWFLARCTPVHGHDGRPIRWFGTYTDITAHQLAEEALQHADRRKDEFLATLAHELRNPLSPLRSGLDLLDGLGEQELRPVLSMMDRQLGHLVHLVDDLMDVSRITRGKIDLRHDVVDLRRVLEQAAETVQEGMKQRGHRFVQEYHGEDPSVLGDPTRLTQVVTNLLNNAVKYTPTAGAIRLSLANTGSEAVVTVQDNGVGIPEALRMHVFDLFAQVDRNLKRAQGGLGIGLNIVKRLVELHGGTVECHSDGPDRGSRFVVRLPLLRAKGQEATAAAGAPATGPALRVLIVDDNEDVARTLALVARKLGNEVEVAFSAAEALRIGPVFLPQLVLMDIGMPLVDGHELCRRMRTEPWGMVPYTVAVSGWGQDEDINRSGASGCDRHVVKPMDRATLIELLQAAAAHRGG